MYAINIYFGSNPHPATVTTRTITFLVGDPKLSFVTEILGGWWTKIYSTTHDGSYFCFSNTLLNP